MPEKDTFPLYENRSGWNALLPAINIGTKESIAESYDFVVIGAGFTGLSAARRLAELNPNARIVVIEAPRVGDGSSGRNSGLSTVCTPKTTFLYSPLLWCAGWPRHYRPTSIWSTEPPPYRFPDMVPTQSIPKQAPYALSRLSLQITGLRKPWGNSQERSGYITDSRVEQQQAKHAKYGKVHDPLNR